jgi:hypothetical protein
MEWKLNRVPLMCKLNPSPAPLADVDGLNASLVPDGPHASLDSGSSTHAQCASALAPHATGWESLPDAISGDVGTLSEQGIAV